jgi:heptosyltransferase I
MKKVLIVKMSSMGDILHTLPALSDAKNLVGDVQFDWVVEPSFAEIPTWHFAVNRVIPIELRKWRKSWIEYYKNGEIKAFLKTLREQEYDLIIDPQGLFKSAVISRLAKGKKRVGFDAQSAKERFIHWAYSKRYFVQQGIHAVERTRLLFAQAFGYTAPISKPEYGIREHFKVKAQGRYIVFLPNTTWATKLWPEPYWIQLGKLANQAGFDVYITSGNKTEKERADRIAQQLTSAKALPRQNIETLGKLLAASHGVVAVDTGLLHLTAALAVPCLSLYGPTDPILTGAYGANQKRIAASYLCSPCLSKTCDHPDRRGPVFPPCFKSVPPDWAWENFQTLYEYTFGADDQKKAELQSDVKGIEGQ